METREPIGRVSRLGLVVLLSSLVVQATSALAADATGSPEEGAAVSGRCTAAWPPPQSDPPAPASPGPLEAVSAAPLTPTTEALPSSRRLERLGGRWRRIARPPFAGPYLAAVWTGDRALVVRRGGRVATYDPISDAWRELRRAPQRFDRFGSPAAWTGQELIVPRTSEGRVVGPTVGGLAFDPATDSWRDIATVTIDRDDPGIIFDTLWTGRMLVVLTQDRQVAAYDPVDDCWVVLPPVPADGWGQRVYWTGSTLLVETRSTESGIAISRLDPATMSWGAPVQGPADWRIARDGAHWVDGRLVYISWNPGGLEGMVHSSFDPVSATWQPIDYQCPSVGGMPTEAGRLLVEAWVRSAYDPRSGTCYRLPAKPGELLSTGGVIWTGRDLLYVSGKPGESDPHRRVAQAYRIPRSLRTRSRVVPFDDPGAADWGPLAVIDDVGTRGPYGAGASGRLVIGERCVTLEESDGTQTSLIWRSGQTRWDPSARQIVFRDRLLGEIRLSDGDRVSLRGADELPDRWPGGQPGPLWLAITAPDESCPLPDWYVHQVAL